MDPAPIPVFCDRCAARGHAGDELFAQFGDLLEFEPVPRKKTRADGWTPEVQRIFIAALALTGSERQAAHAVGKAPFGVTQLRKAEGNEGFIAAHAKAMAFYEAEQSRRHCEGLQAAATHAAHNHHRSPPPPWSGAATRQRRPSHGGVYKPAVVQPLPPPTEERREEMKDEVLAGLLHTYAIKVRAERRCRLEGKIVEADFYVRQICWFETSIELFSGDLMKFFRDIRFAGLTLIDIAATPGMLLLEKIRREQWEKMGEPKRPEHPPLRLCEVQPDGIVTEPLEYTSSDHPTLSHEEQRAAFEERHRKDAEAQLVWEAEALAEAEAWRARVEGNEIPPRNGGEEQSASGGRGSTAGDQP